MTADRLDLEPVAGYGQPAEAGPEPVCMFPCGRTYWLDKLEMVLRPHGETVRRK